ncbi:hypothetical protein C8R43DRAFT_1116173 [Mycena crocata]|nr:hypothetical protein C8R43DRAFT_1116173 [Mycena crocata]
MCDPPKSPRPPDTPSFNPESNPTSNLISKPTIEAVIEESQASGNVTIRQRSRRREVPPLPDDAQVVHPPRTPPKLTGTPRATPSTHRPAPQIRVVVERVANATPSTSDPDTSATPDVNSTTRVPGARTRNGARAKRGGARVTPSASDESPPRADRQEKSPAPESSSDCIEIPIEIKKKTRVRDSAKKDKFSELRSRTADAASLDELAVVLGETVATMRLYSSSSPTVICLKLLGEIHERIANHHEFPAADESRESFGTIVSRTVTAPVKTLAAQLENQHKAIQSLTKTVESLKNAPILSPCPHSPSAPSYAKMTSSPPSPKEKEKSPPLPNPSDERLLVRFNGPTPPVLGLPYPDILTQLNAHLASLNLPEMLYTQKQSATSIFVVPKTKTDLDVLTKQWDTWAPGIFPGAHLAPPETYCYIQVDGIPFTAAGSLVDSKHSFEERNPTLGKVVGTPVWVNKPPSEARIAAIAASGRTPPTAGSLFIRLQSREMVDAAVLGRRVVLAGTAPVVSRGFPNLRICQCWGCYKYGHTRGRCGVTEAKCGGCGKAAHGVTCTEKPSCVNCDGPHRSDSFACPARKRIAELLRQRAVETSRRLDEEMYTRIRATSGLPHSNSSPFLTPLTSALGLSSLPTPSTPLAPRLPELF